MFKSESIAHALLQKRAHEGAAQEEEQVDVVFVLFQESDDRTAPTRAVKFLNALVSALQPAPALAHCELFVPPGAATADGGGDDGARSHFATYLGTQSGWQTDLRSNVNFYLVEHGSRWRALPVFGVDAAARVRAEADREEGVDYSILRYVTALRPLAWTGALLPSTPRSPAHCATLTSRVLQNAIGVPRGSTNSYAPSTLHRALAKAAARMAPEGAAELSASCAASMHALLHAKMSSEVVRGVGDAGCGEAIRALTARVCAAHAGGDAAAQRVCENQLATALLRWSLLR